MPLVRKEDTDELLGDAFTLLDQGAVHQALGSLLSLARRLAKMGQKAPELERVVGAIGDVLKRQDLIGVTAEEEHQLRDAVDLDAVRADLLGAVHAALEPAHASVWISQRG
jgi:ABC-type amino acid transport substrate-binding protein